jgi:hypothetical protein
VTDPMDTRKSRIETAMIDRAEERANEAITERPILFSGAMVRAILDGRKTQTRRVVKLETYHADYGAPHIDEAWVDNSYEREEYGNVSCLKVPYGDDSCPMGKTTQRLYPRWNSKERLWVRETWAVNGCYDYLSPKALTASGMGDQIAYKAGGGYDFETDNLKWRPSIFMPRWASRLTLEVVSVRVERLHKISNADVLAEGVTEAQIDQWRKWLHPNDAPGHTYGVLWDSINGKTHPWKSSPWVWVVSFRKL